MLPQHRRFGSSNNLSERLKQDLIESLIRELNDSSLVRLFKAAVAALYLLRSQSYGGAMRANDLITADPDILGGIPVFKGTRVPVKTLFDYLADSLSLNYFLESFPSVSRELALLVLQYSQQEIEQRAAA